MAVNGIADLLEGLADSMRRFEREIHQIAQRVALIAYAHRLAADEELRAAVVEVEAVLSRGPLPDAAPAEAFIADVRAADAERRGQSG